MNPKHLESLRKKLKAVTLERGFTDQYDKWTEARKALAHELLAAVAELERDIVEDPVQPEPPLSDASLKERASAWDHVCKVLDEVDPTWIDQEGTGRSCALNSIRRLAFLAKAPTINVRCEVRSNIGIVGSTFLEVEQTNLEDDGSYTAVCHVDKLPANAAPEEPKKLAFRLKARHDRHVAGTIVYPLRWTDYGLARDDTEMLGVAHYSVTLNPTGDYPSFTIPVHLLEKL